MRSPSSSCEPARRRSLSALRRRSGKFELVAERAAPTDRRVFITGPAGVGKEVVARLIHSRSRRSSGPFVVANAAMMRPGSRVELELFGSEGETGPLRHPIRARSEPSSAPMAARSSSTRSPTCRSRPRARSRAPCRPTPSSGKAERSRSRSTFASWRRRHATWRPKSRRDAFARTSTIGCWSRPSKCRLSAIAAKISPTWRAPSSSQAVESAGVSPAQEIGGDAMALLQSFDWPGNVRQLRNFVEWLLIMAPKPRQRANRALT